MVINVTTPENFVWEQPVPRIVQYKKKRFALRLEAAYWQQLEALAVRRGQRLGRIIAGLSEAYEGPNLSSYIRGFCMIEAQRDIARLRLGAGSFDLVTLLRGCPAPAILLDETRQILETNQALVDWVGPNVPVLRQAKFDEHFVPRVVRPLDETFALMRGKQLQRVQIQVSFMGRVVNATLTALPVGVHFYCLVWLHTGRLAT